MYGSLTLSRLVLCLLLNPSIEGVICFCFFCSLLFETCLWTCFLCDKMFNRLKEAMVTASSSVNHGGKAIKVNNHTQKSPAMTYLLFE